jgi:hypothetical protein
MSLAKKDFVLERSGHRPSHAPATANKKRVLCIAPPGQHLPLDPTRYNITRMNSPALGLNRMGLEDFELVVVDSRSAEPEVLGVLTEFLRKNQQLFMMIVEKKERPPQDVRSLTQTQVNQRLAETVATLIPL